MRLAALLPEAGPLPDLEVTGISIDSRAVHPGDVFFALAGQQTDGRRYVQQAVARGACVIVSDGPVEAGGAVVVVRSPTPRALLGAAAARLWGDPTAALTLVGVTGTNGKTTTTYLLEAIWRAAGLRPGVIGTIAYRSGDMARPAPLTTPEAPLLQELLAEMRRAGATHVAMEVSSHALALERVAGCRFDAAVFTNLTRDHLDFHGDLEKYYGAKARLFMHYLPHSGKPDPVAVINVDDPMGTRLAKEVRVHRVTYARMADADVSVREVQSTLAGTRGTLQLGSVRQPFRCRLVGAPHVENMLAAAGAAWALGVAPEAIERGLAEVAPPPGRLEQIEGPGFTVIVDYAHSPDALARSLAVLRPLTRGTLITVFGCGGDRDRGKRPLMGEAAARVSDLVVLTSDNPRTENPAAILKEIEPGVRVAGMTRLGKLTAGAHGYVVEADRRTAIRLAIAAARPGDLVLIAGKGHEDYQIIGTEKRPFDDREEVRRAVEVHQ